ncbi:hypothetical protein GCM10018785_47230 [Streptomyces longispororuber]|uniref:Uncharacterized protein n=2 Tax=Streptomyces longispororuber TaxID=68230 RepID=A0A918ZXR7_9ACTN|nr:hypothetical protein GCM10018785_47230 [Streptomyces longispororuber]
MLDFFDDSGVLDEPLGRVGFVLTGLEEVEAMESLGAALDRVLSVKPSCDAETVRLCEWLDVVAAARNALGVMGEDLP